MENVLLNYQQSLYFIMNIKLIRKHLFEFINKFKFFIVAQLKLIEKYYARSYNYFKVYFKISTNIKHFIPTF